MRGPQCFFTLPGSNTMFLCRYGGGSRSLDEDRHMHGMEMKRMGRPETRHAAATSPDGNPMCVPLTI